MFADMGFQGRDHSGLLGAEVGIGDLQEGRHEDLVSNGFPFTTATGAKLSDEGCLETVPRLAR
ncbi:hypothetical protein thsps117_08620 [Pseudomonas sp. No.117]